MMYHYCCDGHDDRGWGCVYRNIQTLLAFYRASYQTTTGAKKYTNAVVHGNSAIPELYEITNFFGKNTDSKGTSMWIEPWQASKFLEKETGTTSRHVLYINGDRYLDNLRFTPLEIYTEHGNAIHTNFAEFDDEIKNYFHDNNNNKESKMYPIMIDNGTYSYLIEDYVRTANMKDKIKLIDPHTTEPENVLRQVDVDWLAGHNTWMVLFPFM